MHHASSQYATRSYEFDPSMLHGKREPSANGTSDTARARVPALPPRRTTRYVESQERSRTTERRETGRESETKGLESLRAQLRQSVERLLGSLA